MLRCLNHIVNGLTSLAWHAWTAFVHVSVSVEQSRCSAGKVMNRCLRRLSHQQYTGAWCRWCDVLAYEDHCGQVMNRSLRHMTNAQYSACWSQWCGVVGALKDESTSEALSVLQQRLEQQARDR